MMRILAIMLWVLVGCRVCAQPVSDHVYVVMINGGMSKLMNHERYWNDCSFLYTTLRQKYRIPKRNITVLMSDGGDPGNDMLRDGAGGFASSPADLDGDGERDVYLTATYQQVGGTLSTLARTLTADDHLFLFLMDHGDTADGYNASYVWLWNKQQLTDQQLAAHLSAFHVGSMSILMGQCNSGGFIDDLQGEGRVIATSCMGNELSWACADKPYDEFVYHWTSAVAGHDADGRAVDADSNGDGRVTMREAFVYAQEHDSRQETPQYVSQPEELGDAWTFFGGAADGIEEIPADGAPAACYSLTGVRRCEGAGAGLYIVNGRKIINKP